MRRIPRAAGGALRKARPLEKRAEVVGILKAKPLGSFGYRSAGGQEAFGFGDLGVGVVFRYAAACVTGEYPLGVGYAHIAFCRYLGNGESGVKVL